MVKTSRSARSGLTKSGVVGLAVATSLGGAVLGGGVVQLSSPRPGSCDASQVAAATGQASDCSLGPGDELVQGCRQLQRCCGQSVG